jgi:hypothetical protein
MTDWSWQVAAHDESAKQTEARTPTPTRTMPPRLRRLPEATPGRLSNHHFAAGQKSGL